jgi:hypothetical protein
MRLMRSVFGHRYMLQTDGGETSSRQTMLRTTKRVHRGAEPSQLMQPKRFNCQNTEDGDRAHGAMRMVVGQMLPTREADAWRRALGVTGRPLAGGFPPLRERRTRGADQGDPAESFVIRQCPRLRAGHHALRLRGEHSPGSG